MSKIIDNMNKFNNKLSAFATADSDALRIEAEEEDYRSPFFRDIDRVLYSLSYIRYIDKTQVFSFKQNSHLQKRMIHVQFVSKIARTIGRALNLNEDLIEAAALGHDLGHVPFGHVGERILNQISLQAGEGYFNHNVHSVRLLMYVEKYGHGQNISYQVLDAILCHNGEFEQACYKPVKKSVKKFLEEYERCYKEDYTKKLVPGTLEGCVVRVSDIIGYLGRDLEDGIRIGLINKSMLPKKVVEVLGTTNAQIVSTLVTDIIKNSIDKRYIKLSDDVFEALVELKRFNAENIYSRAYTQDELLQIEKMFYTLYAKFLNDVETHNTNSIIYKSYLNNMCEKYHENTNERIVLDYIAGMTDDYFKMQYDLIQDTEL